MMHGCFHCFVAIIGLGHNNNNIIILRSCDKTNLKVRLCTKDRVVVELNNEFV